MKQNLKQFSLWTFLAICSSIAILLAYMDAPAVQKRTSNPPKIHFALVQQESTIEPAIAFYNAIYSPLIFPFREMLPVFTMEDVEKRITADPILKHKSISTIGSIKTLKQNIEITEPIIRTLKQDDLNLSKTIIELVSKKQTFQERKDGNQISFALIPINQKQKLDIKTISPASVNIPHLISPVNAFIEWNDKGEVTTVFLEEPYNDKKNNRAITKYLYLIKIVAKDGLTTKGKGYLKLSP